MFETGGRLLSLSFLLLTLEHRASVKRFVSLSFLILGRSVGLLGRGISPSQGRYLHRTTQTQNKRRQISMPWVGFEPTIPVLERAKTVRALDRAATVIGELLSQILIREMKWSIALLLFQSIFFFRKGYASDLDTSYHRWWGSMFSSVPPDKCRDNTSIRPRPLPCSSCPTHYSLIILLFDAI
jgi:hypothetical protein